MFSGIVEAYGKVIGTLSNWMYSYILIILLVGAGIYFTVKTKGVQFRALKEAIKVVMEPKDDEKSISSFQALCTASASCVGSGNIVGVSTAVLAGGMGAIFWMWVAAFVGMATKYGEIILGMLYREKNEEGNYVGGPMYYIKKGLRLPWLATLCAFFMVTQIIGGNFIQSNTISGVMKENFGVPYLTTGIVLVLLIFIITLGGLKRLAHVAQTLVPSMAVSMWWEACALSWPILPRCRGYLRIYLPAPSACAPWREAPWEPCLWPCKKVSHVGSIPTRQVRDLLL